jgi:hypothetical protein
MELSSPTNMISTMDQSQATISTKVKLDKSLRMISKRRR